MPKVTSDILRIILTVLAITAPVAPVLADDAPAAETKATAASPPENTGASKEPSAKPQAAVAKKTGPVKDLPNFHEVHPFLYRGGEPTVAGLEKLKSMGVSTIIDLRAPTEKALNEKKEAGKLGMRYINLIMDSHAPTEKQVQTMLSTIDQAKKKSEDGKKECAVFVHCAHGSDRTGCMIGIWRVTREGWDYPSTYKEMRQYYFTPKFTQLSGAVETYATQAKSQTN